MKTQDFIVIGCSAGGFDALSRIFSNLQADFPVPVAVVIHTKADSSGIIVGAFQQKSVLPVKEAEDKEKIAPGTIYFAPPNYHLLVEENGTFSLSVEEAVHFCRPSIDVLFESAAVAYGDKAMGILLTGANSDGANGLRLIASRGGQTLVQNPASSAFAAMPQSALDLYPEHEVRSLEEICVILRRKNKEGGA